jgi:hypothetical protein
MPTRRSALSTALIFLSCGGGGPGTDGTSQSDLKTLVESGAYGGWKAEPAVHASAGPHGQVRTFVNDALYASMKAGNTAHPNGSIAVKELYSGGAINGWAVDVKRSDGQWVFYEGFKPALNQYYFVGGGNLCANCHQGGVDFVLLPAGALP